MQYQEAKESQAILLDFVCGCNVSSTSFTERGYSLTGVCFCESLRRLNILKDQDIYLQHQARSFVVQRGNYCWVRIFASSSALLQMIFAPASCISSMERNPHETPIAKSDAEVAVCISVLVSPT